MCPTHCWMFPSGNTSNSIGQSQTLSHRSLFPLRFLSRLAAGATILAETRTRHVGCTLLSSFQTPNNSQSPSLPWFKALVLNSPNQLFNNLPTSILSILKTISTQLPANTPSKHNSDHAPCSPSPGSYNGEHSWKPNHFGQHTLLRVRGWHDSRRWGYKSLSCSLPLAGRGGEERWELNLWLIVQKGLVDTEESYCEKTWQTLQGTLHWAGKRNMNILLNDVWFFFRSVHHQDGSRAPNPFLSPCSPRLSVLSSITLH